MGSIVHVARYADMGPLDGPPCAIKENDSRLSARGKNASAFATVCRNTWVPYYVVYSLQRHSPLKILERLGTDLRRNLGMLNNRVGSSNPIKANGFTEK
jgi:hypothetical protein